jgi:NADH dehydrogenase
MKKPHVVILGGGFGGLATAKSLRRAPVRVTLVDQSNHHLFQPLLYQVATAGLSPANIAAPIRRILGRQRNARVLLGEVVDIDTTARTVHLDDRAIPYDYLVVATGVENSYFGNDDWADHAPGLKTIEDALEIRRRVLLAFERAEMAQDPTNGSDRAAALTFAVIGGGPTGVELAGTIAEVARKVVRRDFRNIDTADARIMLIEGKDCVLPGFPGTCGEKAKRQLEELGVEVHLSTLADDIGEGRLTLKRKTPDGDTETEDLRADTIIWGAGVRASPLGSILESQSEGGAKLDKMGRVEVGPDLAIPGEPSIFVIGDLAHVIDAEGREVPGMAPGAIQMGEHVANTIQREVFLDHPKREPFRYKDKGMLATIGRRRAVAHLKGRSFGGLIAWVLWAAVHIYFLIGFRNRLLVMIQWAWLYLAWSAGARLITGDRSGRTRERA